MTGPLTHLITGSSLQEIEYFDGDSGHVVSVRLGTNRMEWTRFAGKTAGYRSDSNPGSRLLLYDTRVEIGQQDKTFPTVGYLRVVADSSTILALKSTQAAALLAVGYDESAVLRWAADNAGNILAANYQGWAQSSTTWRQQFALSGDWQVSTDATRYGEALLSIFRAGGDAEVIRADWDTVFVSQPRLAFFEAQGSYPGDALIRNDGTPFDKLVDQLGTLYGLVDPSDFTVSAQAQATSEALTGWQCCNAGHYIADRVAAIIIAGYDGIDAGDTLADILTSWGGTLDATTAQFLQIVGSLFDLLTGASTIVSDLADVDALGDDICAANFDLETIVANLDGYGWASDTQSIVEMSLRSLWANSDTLQGMIALGKYIDSGACAALTLPCEDRLYDFRWSAPQGWDVDTGVWTFGQGYSVGFDDPYYRVFLYGLFETCAVKDIWIRYYCPNAAAQAQLLQVLRYTDDGMGGYDLDPLYYQTTMNIGEDVWHINIGGAGLTYDKILVRLESETTEYANRILSIQIGVS